MRKKFLSDLLKTKVLLLFLRKSYFISFAVTFMCLVVFRSTAEKLAGHPCVTVSVDDLHFENEVTLGQILSLHAKVNRAFTTSMEVGRYFGTFDELRT